MDCAKLMDKFGIYFDEIGLSKTYGRCFGLFMTAKEPISMGQLVENLQISKSTASTKLRRLLATGVIEKVLLADKRADFYQIKKNMWGMNLNQKIKEVRKLRAITEEIPPKELERFEHLQEMDNYCIFLEAELEILIKKYMKFTKEKK